jgi:hypothetical protein
LKTDWGKGLTETFSDVERNKSRQNLGDMKLRTSARQGDRFLVCLYFLAFDVVPRLVSIEVLKPK